MASTKPDLEKVRLCCSVKRGPLDTVARIGRTARCSDFLSVFPFSF
jgi:hypothetical protein